MNEEQMWAQALSEVQGEGRIEGLWLKAMAECGGDTDKAQAKYIAWRVERLAKEHGQTVRLPASATQAKAVPLATSARANLSGGSKALLVAGVLAGLTAAAWFVPTKSEMQCGTELTYNLLGHRISPSPAALDAACQAQAERAAQEARRRQEEERRRQEEERRSQIAAQCDGLYVGLRKTLDMGGWFNGYWEIKYIDKANGKVNIRELSSGSESQTTCAGFKARLH